MRSMKNVRRVEQGVGSGWQFHSTTGGKPVTRFFSDSKYDGKRKARLAAIEYRDSQMPTLQERSREVRSQWLDPRNTTGVNRVRVATEPAAGGGTYQRVVASVKLPHKTRVKSWRLDKFEYEDALQLAVQWQKRVTP